MRKGDEEGKKEEERKNERSDLENRVGERKTIKRDERE